MILIRTNCNGTLGHLARCAHLAHLLVERGHAVEFVLDTDVVPPGFTAIDGFTRHALHTMLPAELDTDVSLPHALQVADADRVLALATDRQATQVIVDDYRLDTAWETRLRCSGVRVVAIDDTCRTHHVDILVEPGYRTTEPNVHIAPPTLHLAGAAYALLGPAYRTRHVAPFDTAHPTVLLSLGGGGDLSILAGIVRAACENPESSTLEARFVVVQGPSGYNADTLNAVAAHYPERVQVLQAPESLAPWLQYADLFVGAAGTALYETAACNTPALTFALADNQVNPHEGLARIGHFLHLPGSDRHRAIELAELTLALLADRPRLRAMHNTAHAVDGRGCLRVADAIASLDHDAATTTTAYADDPPREERASPNVTFTPCCDRDINHYLDSRNLAANCRNMTSAARIDRLQHYRWWFGSSRTSWRMDLDGVPQLYIWQQARRVGELDVLFGGWFVCRDDVSPTSAMLALQWQLDMTDQHFPEHVWVAVISRDNPFVYRMNSRAGFVDAPSGTAQAAAVAACFPGAGVDAFHQVYRPAAIGVSGCAR